MRTPACTLNPELRHESIEATISVFQRTLLGPSLEKPGVFDLSGRDNVIRDRGITVAGNIHSPPAQQNAGPFVCMVALDKARMMNAVMIGEYEVLGAGRMRGPVAYDRLSESRIFMADMPDWVPKVPRILTDHVRDVSAGTIIRHDQLKVAEGLVPEG